MRGKAGSQPEGFVIGSGFSVVGSQREGEGGNDAMALSPFLSIFYTCLGNWFPSGMKDCTLSIPDWISGALPIFKENVMGRSLLLNFLRGFEDFPDVFPYSHFKKIFF